MPTDYTDGDIFADSFEATIAGDGYVVNNLSLTTPSTMVERNDHKGKLAAKQLLKDFKRINGTAELQIDSEAANVELWGQTFTVPADYNTTGFPLVCVIEEETANVEANASRTRSVNVRLLFIDAMLVEGAGTEEVNGVYLRDGNENEFPKYVKNAASKILIFGFNDALTGEFTPLNWAVRLQGAPIYASTDPNDPVATPDLADSWGSSNGEEPAPTVRRLTFADLAAL